MITRWKIRSGHRKWIWLAPISSILASMPEGANHILFVLGLFLLSCQMKPLLWQVTAFMLAHSITLGRVGLWFDSRTGWRNYNRYRPTIVIPASAVIAATGLLWTFQRIAAAVQ